MKYTPMIAKGGAIFLNLIVTISAVVNACEVSHYDTNRSSKVFVFGVLSLISIMNIILIWNFPRTFKRYCPKIIKLYLQKKSLQQEKAAIELRKQIKALNQEDQS